MEGGCVTGEWWQKDVSCFATQVRINTNRINCERTLNNKQYKFLKNLSFKNLGCKYLIKITKRSRF